MRVAATAAQGIERASDYSSALRYGDQCDFPSPCAPRYVARSICHRRKIIYFCVFKKDFSFYSTVFFLLHSSQDAHLPDNEDDDDDDIL